MKKDRLYACHDVWGGETLFEGLPIRGAAQWSRDTAVACCCCDGADAAAMELMLRAALLRRSRCCDGAAQTSSVALILRGASRRDALNEEPASFSLLLIQISSRGPQS